MIKEHVAMVALYSISAPQTYASSISNVLVISAIGLDAVVR